jgi:hypothetical protein
MTDFALPATAETASVPADVDQIKQLRERAARLGCRLRKQRGWYWLLNNDDDREAGFENLEGAAGEILRRERGDPLTLRTLCEMPYSTYDPKTGQTTNHYAEGRGSWRDHLRVHPAADLFPPMSESELRELGEDIEKNDLLEQPVFYRDPELGICVLDGRNRLDACELIGRETVDASGEPKVGSIRDASGSFDPFAFVISKNIRRRHLNVEQRQELLITLIARQPERSDRQIAKMAGVDHKTIAAARTKGEDVGSVPHVETRTDSRGRKQPATKTKTTKPKPVDHRVTESPETSLEQRRAENAELDLSAEERAAQASASALAEFSVACRAWLPKVTVEADRQAARNLVATLTCSKCREAV